MRQILLDTETTGLDPAQGHRIIEIGAVEMVHRRLTGKRFHHYLNPGREIDAGAMEVHGITNEMLADKPVFADVAAELVVFLRDAEVIIHNAPFDTGFLDKEFALMSSEARMHGLCTVTDTLAMARKRHTGQQNNLNALCRRYKIDNSHRTLHGALLDAEILADVYLALTGGQTGLFEEAAARNAEMPGAGGQVARTLAADRPPLKVVRVSEAEREAHQAWLTALDKAAGGRCLWRGVGAAEEGEA